jgi:hypothetical protein
VARRLRRVRERRPVRKRIARFVRQPFGGGSSSWLPDDPRWDEPAGGVGVREPRHPRRPTLSGAAAVEPPPDGRRDVWAVGSD